MIDFLCCCDCCEVETSPNTKYVELRIYSGSYWDDIFANFTGMATNVSPTDPNKFLIVGTAKYYDASLFYNLCAYVNGTATDPFSIDVNNIEAFIEYDFPAYYGCTDCVLSVANYA